MRGKRPATLVVVWNILALGLLILVAGCSNDESAIEVDLNRRTDLMAPGPGKSLAYAYLPQYSHQTSYERHRLLVEYLRDATGLSFRQVYPDTFDEHEKMVMRGEIDISFSNPFVYVRLAKGGALAFARTIELSGRPDFYSRIIVRADNRAIRTIQDCRGKRWIAVDPTSAGGYLFALGHFHDQGLFPEDFAEIAFAPGPGGKQEKVILAVYAGTYDIGSVRDGALELMGDRIDLSQIRVLAESRHYPGWVYSARSGLDPRVVERVAQAMLALAPDNPAHRKILDTARFQAIVASEDDDYQPIRDLVTKLELD
jgi:phosphonate transport system substrate-binding protein